MRETLMTAPVESKPEELARSHAVLPGVDPAPVIKSLRKLGTEEDTYNISNRMNHHGRMANQIPLIHDSVERPFQNRSPEPNRLAIGPCEFYPMKILQLEGKVTGGLDRADFPVADRALDVASTIGLLTCVAFDLHRG
jgi:hypothetical protein